MFLAGPSGEAPDTAKSPAPPPAMERNFDRRRPGVAATLLAASCWACSVITAAPVTLPHVGDTSESSSTRLAAAMVSVGRLCSPMAPSG